MGREHCYRWFPASGRKSTLKNLNTAILEQLVAWVPNYVPVDLDSLKGKISENTPISEIADEDLSQTNILWQWLIPQLRSLCGDAPVIPCLEDLDKQDAFRKLWFQFGPKIEDRCWTRSGPIFTRALNEVLERFGDVSVSEVQNPNPEGITDTPYFENEFGTYDILHTLHYAYKDSGDLRTVRELCDLNAGRIIPWQEFVDSYANIRVEIEDEPEEGNIFVGFKGWSPEIAYTGNFLVAYQYHFMEDEVDSMEEADDHVDELDTGEIGIWKCVTSGELVPQEAETGKGWYWLAIGSMNV
jgi:hypothetical protein